MCENMGCISKAVGGAQLRECSAEDEQAPQRISYACNLSLDSAPVSITSGSQVHLAGLPWNLKSTRSATTPVVAARRS